MVLPDYLVTVIKRSRTYLTQEVEPVWLYSQLRSEGALTAAEIENCKLNATRSEQVRRILKTLEGKSPRSYEVFKSALRANQKHIYEKLCSEEESVRYKDDDDEDKNPDE